MRTVLLIFAFGPLVGFVFALILLVHLLRQRRSPASTIAWVLGIFLLPVVVVPFYMVFGGRKASRMTRRKDALPRVGDLPGRPTEGEQLAERADGLFPRRDGNELGLLATGQGAFRAVLDLIESARESVHVATFILGRDETGKAIVEALTRKAADGLEVRLLLDAVGCRKVRKRMLAPLKAAGGRYAFFMPMLHMPFHGRANLRNHRKIVLIDRQCAVIGGMNLAEEYMGPRRGRDRWEDLSLSVRGPVVSDIYTVFSSDWQFAAGKALPPMEAEAAWPAADGIPLQLLPSGPDVEGDLLFDTIVASFFAARRRIWIVTPYFIPDEMIVKALCIAARRKVDVRIVVPAVSNHRLADMVRRSYLRQIQDEGGSVHRFMPGMLHGKVIIVDDSLAIVGSMNVDMRSLFLNYEIACLVYSQRTVSELAAWTSDVMRRCEQGVTEASVPVEFIEGVGRLLAPLL